MQVTPTKIPRVIGRKGSMISMIKTETGCQIILGLKRRHIGHWKNNCKKKKLPSAQSEKLSRNPTQAVLTDRITQLLKEKKPSIKVEETQN